MDILFFLGRFHVLLLHLPIGIILAVVVLEFIARRTSYPELQVAGPFLWAMAAVTAGGTVAMGYLHYFEGGFEGLTVTLHMISGTSLAAVATLAWFLRAHRNAVYARAQPVIGTALVLLVFATGHFGGNLTHGSTYLAEFAPEPFRSMAGLEPRRPAVTELAMADPYLDVVRPVLRRRCSSCHNNNKKRGELNLATFTAMLEGGESGPAIVPGDANSSELYRRITLAQDHEDFMPQEGKTPLTHNETQVVGWWIDVGAPRQTTLASLDISEVEPLLANVLALDGDGFGAAARVVYADETLVNHLTDAGFRVRQLSLSDPRLIVRLANSPGAVFGDPQHAALAAAGDQVVELKLRGSGVEDAQLDWIAQLSSLTHLYLENNSISDTGLSKLVALEKLEYLNLVGNQAVTDAGITALAELDNLREVFLWNTGVSTAGVDELHSQHPDLIADLGVAVAVDYGEPAKIHGSWDATYVAGPAGPKTAPMILEQEGNKATGTFDGFPVLVTIKGGEIVFLITVDSPVGELRVLYIGTVKGDSIDGLQQTAFGDAPWSAVRSGPQG